MLQGLWGFFSRGLKSFSAADSHVNYCFPQSRINIAPACLAVTQVFYLPGRPEYAGRPLCNLGPFLSSQGSERHEHRNQPCFAFESLGQRLLGCSARPRKQRANCPGLIDQNLLKSVAKGFNLLSPSALMDRAGVSKKKDPLIFPLTAGLDNEVKMTLSLIKVICRNH